MKHYKDGIKKNLIDKGVGMTVVCSDYSPMDANQYCPGVLSLTRVSYLEVSIGDRVSRNEVNRRWNDKVYVQWANGNEFERYGRGLHTILYLVEDDDVIYRYICTTYGYIAICPSCSARKTIEFQEIQKFSTDANMNESNSFERLESIYVRSQFRSRFIDMLEMIKGLYSVKEAGYMRLYDDDDGVILVLEISEDMQAVRDTLLVPRNGRLDSFIM
jgi:hypothetical protein